MEEPPALFHPQQGEQEKNSHNHIKEFNLPQENSYVDYRASYTPPP